LSRRNWRHSTSWWLTMKNQPSGGFRSLTAKNSALSNDQVAVDRGAPPPTRIFRARHEGAADAGNSIIGLFRNWRIM
jgi:hypothetical protein